MACSVPSRSPQQLGQVIDAGIDERRRAELKDFPVAVAVSDRYSVGAAGKDRVLVEARELTGIELHPQRVDDVEVGRRPRPEVEDRFADHRTDGQDGLALQKWRAIPYEG